jgi:hydrogenase expression/formation protein HypE
VTERITLGHGGGGLLTLELVREVFVARLSNPALAVLDDAASLAGLGPLVMTTDSFVVSPLRFPGGDIGKLAVCGTVNDLAVAGAVPRYLTLGAILEEGLEMPVLDAVVASIAAAATDAGVEVVAGDTKVVERGKGDGIYLNTAGVGVVREAWREGAPAPSHGDAVLVSGPVGDHGAVILAGRLGIDPGAELVSDCAVVTPLVAALFDAGVVPSFLRDPTRGGVAGVLCDLAENTAREVRVDEGAIPVSAGAATVCELAGTEPLQLACEGRVVAVVRGADAERALALWRNLPGGRGAATIGRLGRSRADGRVVLETRYGGERLVARPTADPLPRIC